MLKISALLNCYQGNFFFDAIENAKKSIPNSDFWKVLSKHGKKEKKPLLPHEDAFSSLVVELLLVDVAEFGGEGALQLCS